MPYKGHHDFEHFFILSESAIVRSGLWTLDFSRWTLSFEPNILSESLPELAGWGAEALNIGANSFHPSNSRQFNVSGLMSPA
ncbi:hypothetical protein ACKFKG_26975 [Phormidesmis sp. 146-35]